MKEILFNLQLFAEGGDASGSTSSSSDFGIAEGADKSGLATTKKGKEDLSNVVYGKASEPSVEETEPTQKTKAQAFEDLIKGEYKEEFSKRTQGIIDERFKKTKGMEEALKSHDPIMKMLSEKYGVDANDVKGLTKAIEEDKSFYEEEALEKGLTVEQLKEVKRLERENAEFRNAQAEAERQANSNRIYAGWLEEASAFSEKYGIDIDLNAECENPEFTGLLANGISIEGAYKAIHFDEMIGGAMAKTAENVRQKMAQGIATRQARPSENGASSQTATVFKTDVNKLTKADRDEIERRVARGETVTF